MVIINYILNNYVMIFELIGLLIMLRISAHISERMKRLTIAVIVLLLAEALLTKIGEYAGKSDALSLFSAILIALIYSIYPIILILVMRITSNREFSKKKLLILFIPEILSMPIYFSSQWTRIVFFYDETNTYVAGPLNRLPYFIFGLYTVIFLVHNLFYFKRYSRNNRFVTYFIIFGAIFGVGFYMALDFTSDYSALFAAAIVLYYLCIYIHMSKIDPLTSLPNRQSYYNDIKTYGDKITGVVSVDMNELKYINDHHGHEAGDEALKAVSHALWENCGKGGAVYRVGGDEFVIFYINTSEGDIKANIDVMKIKVEKKGYVCAFGYSMKGKQESVDAVLSKADAKMYIDKEETKKKMLEKGITVHYRED